MDPMSNQRSHKRDTRYAKVRERIITAFEVRILDWVEKFEKDFGVKVFFALEGAMRCKLYRGKKPSDDPKTLGQRFHEIDYGIRLVKQVEAKEGIPEDLNPQDARIKEMVTKVAGLEWSFDVEKNGWQQPAPMSIYYGYFPFGPSGKIVQMEVCVQRESECCEVSEFWHLVYSSEETALLRERRDRAELISEEAYKKEKHKQNEEAKFRWLYGLATGRFSPAPVLIRQYIPKWHHFIPDRESPPPRCAGAWVRQAWELGIQKLSVEENKSA